MSAAFAPLDLRVDELLSVEAMRSASVSGDPDLHCVIHLAGSFGYLRMEQRSIFVTVVRARSGYTTRVVGPGVFSTCHVVDPWQIAGHGMMPERARVVSLAESYCKSSVLNVTLYGSTELLSKNRSNNVPGLITSPMRMPALSSNHTKQRVITCRASKQDNDIIQNNTSILDAEPLGGLSHPC
ncbi:hypothetical protein FGADI_1064 [Fusarium gaditjirri]|uniref:Uncharacterized protein n=1 Tax=Fusarium gaditjirri TaxID=282569 RepID=A0A8H4TME8_9HYPO|nr:hypothetical protein FGADI_1064 [Fusarium gaditjirri]